MQPNAIRCNKNCKTLHYTTTNSLVLVSLRVLFLLSLPLLQCLCCSASVAAPLLQCLCCSASVAVPLLQCLCCSLATNSLVLLSLVLFISSGRVSSVFASVAVPLLQCLCCSASVAVPLLQCLWCVWCVSKKQT